MKNKNLLIGNGINIQFDNKNYTTQQIVLRILKNCDCDDFPSHIIVDYPYLLKNYLGELYLKTRNIIAGDYDKFIFGNAEKLSVESFKKRYSDKIRELIDLPVTIPPRNPEVHPDSLNVAVSAAILLSHFQK